MGPEPRARVGARGSPAPHAVEWERRVYDRLGGHIIANALLAKCGQTGFETWIREPSTTTLLAGDYNDRHPLADDIMYSLAGQVPRRFHSKQLWQLVDEPMRSRALRTAARLEPAYLDTATVDPYLTSYVKETPSFSNSSGRYEERPVTRSTRRH